jgi:hypothetical protein
MRRHETNKNFFLFHFKTKLLLINILERWERNDS